MRYVRVRRKTVAALLLVFLKIVSLSPSVQCHVFVLLELYCARKQKAAAGPVRRPHRPGGVARQFKTSAQALPPYRVRVPRELPT